MKKSFPKLKIENGITYIYDSLRKKYLVLTPEEKVRQGFVYYLIEQKGYAKSLIKLELGTQYNKMQKRTDILIFDSSAQPYMLVECKAEDVNITQSVVEQASRYNLVFRAPYLCVTNGRNTFCFEIDFEKNTFLQLKDIPLPKI